MKTTPSLQLAISPTKPIDLDKLQAGQIGTTGADLKFLGSRAVHEFDAIQHAEKAAACRAVLFGCVMHQIKAGLGHGHFGKWRDEHFTAAKERQVRYWMQLAATFSRSQKLLLPELVALPQLTLELSAPNSLSAAALKKVETFVGTRSLNELLELHGIKKRGGAQTPKPDQEPAAPAAASRSPEAEAYQQLVDAATDAEKILLDETRWSILTPELAAQVEPLLKRLLNRFHERLLQARHETA